MKRAVISVAVAATVACTANGILGVLPEGDTPDGVLFEANDTLVAVGDTATLLLANNTGEAIGYNLCLGYLERHDGRSWRSVRKMPEGSACTLALYVLPQGDSAVHHQPIHTFLERGVYRLRDRIQWIGAGGEAEIISNGFRVR